jgi:hypothetical protein
MEAVEEDFTSSHPLTEIRNNGIGADLPLTRREQR